MPDPHNGDPTKPEVGSGDRAMQIIHETISGLITGTLRGSDGSFPNMQAIYVTKTPQPDGLTLKIEFRSPQSALNSILISRSDLPGDITNEHIQWNLNSSAPHFFKDAQGKLLRMAVSGGEAVLYTDRGTRMHRLGTNLPHIFDADLEPQRTRGTELERSTAYYHDDEARMGDLIEVQDTMKARDMISNAAAMDPQGGLTHTFDHLLRELRIPSIEDQLAPPPADDPIL